jgi:hypothetical protein
MPSVTVKEADKALEALRLSASLPLEPQALEGLPFNVRMLLLTAFPARTIKYGAFGSWAARMRRFPQRRKGMGREAGRGAC